MKLCCVVGTRPEFIKLRSVILAAPERGVAIDVIHTGQHYDATMSDAILNDLGLPEPREFLGVGSGNPAEQLGRALPLVADALTRSGPDATVVVGDTNTTLSGTLASIGLGIPLAHVEAGVRSFDFSMPEEIIRRAVDSIATVCFAPTERALRRLVTEGRGDAAHYSGDTLVETSQTLCANAQRTSKILATLNVRPHEYSVVTLHRAQNVDVEATASELTRALRGIPGTVVFPMHPRTRKMLERFGLLEGLESSVRVIEPLGFYDFLALISQASLAVTDSGGVQQEASIFGVPAITPRWNTEWIETVEAGKNVLTGVDADKIMKVATQILTDPETHRRMRETPSPFRPGAAKTILDVLTKLHSSGRLAIARSNFIDTGLPA